MLDQRKSDHPNKALARRDLLGFRARMASLAQDSDLSGRMPARLGYILSGIGLAIALALIGVALDDLEKQDTKLSAQAKVLTVQAESLRKQDRANIRALIRNCRRVNVTNAFARSVTDKNSKAGVIASTLFPILDCDVAARDQKGEGIPLPLPEQDKYVDIIGRERLPIVEGGHIVGSQPFPPAGPSGGPEPSAGG